MSEYTPGPWVAHRNSAFWEIDADTSEGLFKLGDVCASDPEHPDGGLQEANARLIAAAPELLEALEMMLDMSEMGGFGKSAAEDTARAAIAKARGATND